MAQGDTGIAAYASLGADINKRRDDGTLETAEGVVSEKLPELTLKMSNKELIDLTEKWEKDWKESAKKQEWEKQIEENEKYWLGQQFDLPKLNKSRPNVDNLIFESLETFLPQATRRNPEPLVELDSTEIPQGGSPEPAKLQYVEKVKMRLSDLADKNKLRLKLKKGTRHWAIFQLGVAKFGWDLDKDMPIVRIIRPKKMILDPDATIDEDGYTGNRLGEYRKMEASRILGIIGDPEKMQDENPNKASVSEARKKITELVKEDLGTDVQFVEWWTPQYVCWKLDKTVLLKKKNPHWNYDTEAKTEQVDDYGNATPGVEPKQGINHFESMQMPYTFLSIFNLGDQPMDKTSLISQNLSNQDKINKRNKQIDKNADKMNGGAVVSLGRSGLTQGQAKGVVDAVRRGGAVIIPDGAPQDAVYFPQVPGLPNDVYNDLQDTRQRLRDIFGTKGSSQAGTQDEKTLGGKILARNLDTDRIGGGVTEYLEQWTDDWYNWFVQLLYVYDTGFQFIEGGRPPRIIVSVKEGSLLPKDAIAIANQALDLARLNRISNIDLYKRLEYPNPDEMAANVWLEQNAPMLLYKDNELVQEALALMQQTADKETIKESSDKTREQENSLEQIAAKNAGRSSPTVPAVSGGS